MMQITPTGWAETGKWNGTPVEGSPFTLQQLERLKDAELDPETVGTRIVKLRRPRERTMADIACMRPLSECYDEVQVLCPVVRRDFSNVTVVAPGGDNHSLPAEGWTRAKRKP